MSLIFCCQFLSVSRVTLNENCLLVFFKCVCSLSINMMGIFHLKNRSGQSSDLDFSCIHSVDWSMIISLSFSHWKYIQLMCPAATFKAIFELLKHCLLCSWLMNESMKVRFKALVVANASFVWNPRFSWENITVLSCCQEWGETEITTVQYSSTSKFNMPEALNSTLMQTHLLTIIYMY